MTSANLWNNPDIFIDKDLFSQVGKTHLGKRISPYEFMLTLDGVIQHLNLSKDDCLLDICCGNGLILNSISHLVKYSVGIDISDYLVQQAIEYKPDNVYYFSGYDIVNDGLPSHLKSNFNKYLLHAAIQYFPPHSFVNILNYIDSETSPFLFYIVDIPDSKKFNIFYDTEEKIKMRETRIYNNEEHLLHFYDKDQLVAITESKGFKCKIINQHRDLKSSNYFRFNFIIYN